IRMQALIDWLAAALEEGSAHLIQLAAKLHHDFVLIHPFDDGNGRVARMLVNYLLLRDGYPPLVVPTERKSDYLTALRLADAGDLTPLADFLAEEVERSLKLGTRAAKGESIEESGDVEKEVTLFVRGEKAQQEREISPSVETLRYLAETTLIPFIRELERKLGSLKPVFGRYEVATTTSKGASSPSDQVSYHLIEFPPVKGWVRLSFRFLGYKGVSTTSFNLQTEVEIRFSSAGYIIAQDEKVIFSRDYFQPLLAEEIDQVTASILSRFFDEVRAEAAKTD
ncbi:MAG: ibpA, partial [Akkermansiaceae bacterium]|nr:ibpA [Akkermansiaceae bacterium]